MYEARETREAREWHGQAKVATSKQTARQADKQTARHSMQPKYRHGGGNRIEEEGQSMGWKRRIRRSGKHQKSWGKKQKRKGAILRKLVLGDTT
jgi:hypothetical protein